MDWLTDSEVWASLLTLTALEIVLGIDNLVFITILASRLPVEFQHWARQVGLGLALITRLTLLASVAWVFRLTEPLAELLGHIFSWRDIIQIAGGLFLLYKGTRDIHQQLEGEDPHEPKGKGRSNFGGVLVQIVLVDAVFSLDSVITAVGMATQFWVMAVAIVAAVIVMLGASRPLSAFINRHPTVKTLALSFLMLIGMMLIADGVGFHVPKGYIYFAIGFSICVEALNQFAARRRRNRRRTSLGAGADTQPAAEEHRQSAGF
jgi:predicted tellurium resistance membrane protein TerC